MNKILYIFLMILLLSCNKTKKIKDYYPSGELKLEYEIDNHGKIHGKMIKYYSNGNLKEQFNYHDGKIIDTFSFYNIEGVLYRKSIKLDTLINETYTKYYYSNGNVKSEGKDRNGLALGLWKYYYSNGKLEKFGEFQNGLQENWWTYNDSLQRVFKKEEYKIIKDSIFLNQIIQYNEDESINFEKSSFFDISISDSLVIGKNAGRINYFSDFKKSNVFVVIENEYNDKIKKDTFFDFTHNPKFGVFIKDKSIKLIKGEIIETYYSLGEINKDSLSLDFFEKKKFFEKKILFIDNR